MVPNTKQALSRLWPFMRRHLLQYTLLLLCLILKIGFVLFLPYITQMIVDNAILRRDLGALFKYSALMLSMFTFEGCIGVFADYITTHTGKKIASDVRIQCLVQLDKQSGKYHSEANSGDILATLFSDMSAVESLSTAIPFGFLSNMLTILAVIAYFSIRQWELLLYTLLAQPIILLIQRYFQKKIIARSESLRDTYGRLTSLLDDRITNGMGQLLAKANNFFFKKYIPTEEKVVQEAVRVEATNSLSSASMGFLSTLVNVGILGIGGLKIIEGTLSLGGLMAFSSYAQRLISPILGLSRVHMQFRQNMVSLKRVLKILDISVDIEDGIDAQDMNSVSYDIAFDRVSFAYTENTHILNDLNLCLHSGSICALVGKSGCGKSTITNLLYRLWDVNRGRILIGGQDIRTYKLSALRENIGIVSQDVYLFSDTIENNILLGREDITEEGLSNILRSAGLEEFVVSLPLGLKTQVGEKGIKLSGGQCQRISIARALAMDAKILILDEATSALDNHTEKKIMQEIQNNHGDKTVIVITHRLSSLRYMDRIFVLENGGVLESGRFDELLEKKGEFYAMYHKKKRIGTQINLPSMKSDVV